MGKIIPQIIKCSVIDQWLGGIPRDTIARNLGIGQGTVSLIVDISEQTDIWDVDLLRSVSKEIRQNGLDLLTLASSIRIKRRFQQIGISEKRIDNILDILEVNCFKKTDEEVEQFWTKIDTFYDMTHNYCLSIDDLLDFIDEKQSELKELEMSLLNKLQEIKEAEFARNDIMRNIEMYIAARLHGRQFY